MPHSTFDYNNRHRNACVNSRLQLRQIKAMIGLAADRIVNAAKDVLVALQSPLE